MNKNNMSIYSIVSIILVIVYIVKSIVDYIQYSPLVNSAPYYVWLIINALYFLVPAFIIYIIGVVIKKRKK